MSDRPVGRCIGCFHNFATGPCGGCGAEAGPYDKPPLIGLDGYRVPCQQLGCSRRADHGSRCNLHVVSEHTSV